MSADIIPLPRTYKPHAIEPTETLLFGESGEFVPREQFGLRPPASETLSNMMAKYGGEDRVKRAGRKAAIADGRKISDPELDKDLSAQVAHFAEVAWMLSDRIARAGHAVQSVTMGDIAGFAETISAELLIPHTPESA